MEAQIPQDRQNLIGSKRKIVPKAPEISLHQPGRLRVSNLLALFGISHSTFYNGLKTGRYPLPDGRDGKVPYWRTETIRAFLAD